MKLLENIYQSSDFNIKKSTLTLTWTNKTGDMTEDEFRDSMLRVIENVRFYHPRHMILDFKRMNFTVSIALQSWIVGEVMPKLEKQEVYKLAIIRPHRFIPKVSTEQWVDDLKYHPDFEMKATCVDTTSAAIAWLYYDVMND